MSKLDLNALRVFVNVVEKRQLQRGGAGITYAFVKCQSPDFSTGRKKLQLRLIQRSTRHMHLTDAGQAFFNSMRPLLDQLAATEAALTQQQADPEGLLRLCLPNEIGPTLFGPMLARFAMRYPKNRSKLCDQPCRSRRA